MKITFKTKTHPHQRVLGEEETKMVQMESNKEEKTEFEPTHIPEGMYVGTYIDEQPMTPHEKFGERVRCMFALEGIQDQAGKPIVLPRIIYTKSGINPGTNAGKMLIALGIDITDGQMDTSAYIGGKCNCVIKTDTDKDGQKKSYISDQLRIVPQQPQSVPPAQPTPPTQHNKVA